MQGHNIPNGDEMSEEVEEIVVVTSKKVPAEKLEIEGARVVDAESSEGKEFIGDTKSPLPRAFAVMRSVRACEIVKQEGKLVAKCGEKTVDLTKMSEKAEGENDEDCPTCGSAIAVGWAINYVKPLNNLIANKIFEDVTDEKITADEAMDKCLQLARSHGKTDLVETIEQLKEMMHKPMEDLEKEANEPNK